MQTTPLLVLFLPLLYHSLPGSSFDNLTSNNQQQFPLLGAEIISLLVSCPVVCVLSNVTAAGRVMLGQYDWVSGELNQESCKERGVIVPGLGGSQAGIPHLAQAVLPTATLALLPLPWAVPFSAPAAWNPPRAAPRAAHPSRSQRRTSHPLQTPAGRAGAEMSGCSAPSATAPSTLPGSQQLIPCGALCSTPR